MLPSLFIFFFSRFRTNSELYLASWRSRQPLGGEAESGLCGGGGVTGNVRWRPPQPNSAGGCLTRLETRRHLQGDFAAVRFTSRLRLSSEAFKEAFPRGSPFDPLFTRLLLLLLAVAETSPGMEGGKVLLLFHIA